MAKKTIWDISLEIAGKDTGASAALRQVQRSMKDVQDSGKQLSKDFGNFTKNAGKLALGVVAGVTAAGAATLKLAGDFATAGDQAAKTADSLGMSIEGYQRLRYAMGTAGVEAADFDGAIQKLSNNLNMANAGNETAAKMFESVGLSARDFANMKPEESFALISDRMKELGSDAERTQVAITLFGKTAGPRMMAAMKMGSEGLRAMGDEAQSLGVIITEEQARASENYGSALGRMQSAFGGLKNQFIGGAIGPISQAFDHLKDAMVEQGPVIAELGQKFGAFLADGVKKLPEIIQKVQDFEKWIKDTVTSVANFVGGFENLAKIVAMLAIAPTFISGIKVVISSAQFLITVIKGIQAGMALLKVSAAASGAAAAAGGAAGATGFGAMAAAVWAATWPVLAVIAAIAAVIAIVVLVVKNFDKIKEVAGIVWNAVCGFVGKAVDFIKNIFGGIADFFGGIWDGVKNIAGNAWEGIKNVASGAWEGIKGAASKAWEGIKKAAQYHPVVFAFNKIKEHGPAAFAKVKEAAGKAWDSVKSGASNLWQGVKNGSSKAGEFLKGNWKTIALGMVNPWAGGLKAMYDHNEKFRNFVDNSWGKIKDVAGSVWDKMPDGVKNVFFKISGNIRSVIDGIKSFFTGLWDAIKHGPSATIEYLKNALLGLWENIKGVFSSVGSFFSGVWGNVKNFAGNAWNGIQNVVGNALDGIKNGATAMKDKAVEGFNKLKENAGTAFNKILDVGEWGLRKLEERFPFLVGTGRDAFNAIKQAASGDFSGIKEFGNNTLERLKTGFSSFKDSTSEKLSAVGDFFGNVFEAIKNVTGSVGNFFKGVWENAVGFVRGIFDGFRNFFSSVFDIIKTVVGLFSDFFKNVFVDPVGAVKNLFFGIVDVIKGIFDSIKEKVQSFVSFFADKFKIVGDVIGGVKDFFGGVGNAVSGAVGGVGNFFKGLVGHADGGIFTHRHIAEIAERGAEAVVPLDRSPNGFDIWKQAGEIGGYANQLNKQKTANTSTSSTPPVMEAAARNISNSENVININYSQNNTFTGGTPDKETVNQVSMAGQQAAEDFTAKVKQALDEIMRNQRRVSFA